MKGLDEYKLDDEVELVEGSLLDKVFEKPVTLVAISYTLQDKNGSQTEIKYKSSNYQEDYDDEDTDDFTEEDEL